MTEERAGADQAYRLDGLRALVTGGTRGTGYEIARELHAAGAKVILTGRDAATAARVAGPIGAGVIGLGYDAAEEGAEDRLAAEVIARWDRMHVLVNNAATLTPHFLERVGKPEFDAVFRVNLRAPMFLTLALKPLLAAGGRASVVNITAAGAHRPIAGLGCYTASKAALINFSGTMAKEWAADGIRVNALTPGSIATDFILPKDPEKRARFQEEMGAQNLQKRLAHPAEIARVVRFLASDAASFITGSTLVADGGFLA